MPKQLNVNLAFTADTKQAKAQIEQLQHQLTELVNMSGKGNSHFALTKEIQQATTAAAQLKAQIKGATDVDTGKLDLTKFTQAMTDSGMSLKKYQQQLGQLGPAGDRAFASLAASINNADARLKNANGMLSQFATTLKNTARWQISSSILHGFMGSLQAAYGYAQNLNQSLNNIRIVTGASTDEMASFAVQANKAAQALSTTTTSYTDAALIYYQQGIRDQEEIAGRTETTIKLANVSRQSAEEVSQQMTAIWNNFYDGSKSLEFYADAITALGATTASSSAEIAAGLEKFAAIADTVGLSYEYATAAMATITAQTRQSADTVGTGLRTLFSRLEGLKLGETLEDGVDLNKYSEALSKVGVQVMDATGQLRDMDDILDDLGARWDQLGRAEQTALAQTVGGVRQYTNLIALMDNWDQMKQNVLTAEGAEGTLQEQADIYAESWEAAQKRVRAAWEEVYSSVFDDKFFIKMTNGLAKFVNVIGDAVDGLGGMKGVLLLIGSIITKMFSQDLSNGIAKMTSGFQMAMMGGQKYVEQQRREANELLMKSNVGDGSIGGANIAASYQAQGELQNAYLDSAQKLSAEQQQIAQQLLDQNRLLGENAREQALVTKAVEEEVAASERLLSIRTKETQQAALQNGLNTNREKIQQLGAVSSADTKLYNIAKDLDFSKSAAKNEQVLKQLEAELQTLQKGIKETGGSFESTFGKVAGSTLKQMLGSFKDGAVNMAQLEKAWSHWTSLMGETDSELEKIVQALTAMKTGLDPSKMDSWGEKQKTDWAQARTEIEGVVQGYQHVGAEAVNCAEKTGQVKVQAESTKQAFDEMAASVSQRVGAGITAGTSALMSFGMALSSIKSLGSIWSNEDVSLGDKIISTMTSLGIIVPSLTAAFKAENIEKIKGLALDKQQLASLFGLQAMKTQEGAIIWKNIGAKTADAAASATEAGAELVEATAAEVDAVAHLGLGKAIWEVVKARLASLTSMVPYLAALLAIVAAVGAVIAVAKLISNIYNADAIAAENAAAAAHNLAEALNETRQAYDDLKTSIENYHSAKDAISSLTQGTQEWKDAIRESNTEALKLINSLGLIKDADYTIDKDGIIRIDEDALNKAIEAKSQEVDQAQNRSLMADQTAKQAKTEADITTLKRSSGMGDQIDKAIERLTSGDLADQFAKGLLDTEGLKDALGIQDTGIVEEIAALATTIRQNTDIQQITAEQAAKTSLENNKAIQQSGYAEEISKAAGNIYNQAYQDSYDKYLGVAEQNDYQTMKLFADYVKETGLDQKRGFQLEGTDKQGNQQYSYIDEETGKRTEVITVLDEEIAAVMAAAEADQQLVETSSGLIGAFKKLDEAGTVGSQALKKFLANGDLNALKSSELNEMNAQTSGGKTTAKYLGGALGDQDGTLSDEEAQALGYESAQVMVEAFNEGLSNAQDNIANAGKDLIPSFMQDAFEAVSENSDLGVDSKTAIASAIDNALSSGGNEAAKKLMNQFMEASQAGELTDAKIEEIIASAEELSAVDLETLTNQIAEINSIISGLETGDSISADDYAKLSAEQQSYFAMAMDGTYQLIGSAEELRDITSEANFEKFKQMGSDAANTANTYGSAANIAADQGVDALSQSAYLGSPGQGVTEFDASLLETQIGLIQEYQGELDVSNAKLAEWQEQLQNGTIDPAMLNDVAAKVGELALSEEDLAQKAADAAAKQQELQTAMALSAENTNELQAMLEDGSIGPEAFNQGLEKLHNTLDEDIDVDQYKELSDYFEEFGDEIDGVSKDMKGNKKASRELAKEISRFDAAITSVGENYNDWMTDLKKGDKNSTTHAKTIKGLRNAYGDLLDVSGDTLSKNFLENAENLDLMAKAAEGDEEAYNKLQDAVREDIATTARFDDAEFQAGFDDLMNKYYEGQNLDDLEVGASLNNEGFLQGLTDMVNAAGMTAQQATDYLASMGIDAEVVEDTSTDTETNEVTGYTASGGTVTRSYSIPKVSGSGEDMSVNEITGTATFPYFTVQPDTQTVTTQKENKSFGLKVTSANKSSGGGFKHANSSGGGGGGGGGCFIAGTLISTSRGFIPIEQIHQGDIVLSYDEQMHKNVYSPVVKTMIHALWTNIYTINIGIEQLKATEIHPFYIKRAGIASWLPASELRAGDLVLLASGIWKEIDEIKIKFQFKIVYNFEVSNTHNYYVGKTQILAHNKGGGRRRGGGGRRAERNRAANIRTNEDLDRYHVVTTKLSKLESQLNKVSTAYDRAFGTEKLKLLDKQIRKQEQLIATQKEYTSEIEDYLKKDKKRFAKNDTEKFWSDTAGKTLSVKTDAAHYLGMEVNFDENGTILNYEELVKAANKKYNAAAKKYRSTKQGNKKAEIAWEKAQAQRDGFLENLAQLEETQQLYLDQKQAEQEMINELYDMKLEETQLIVKLQVDVEDDKLKTLDHLLNRIGDDAYKAAERINLLGKQAESSFAKIEAYNKGVQGLFSNHGISVAQLNSESAGDLLKLIENGVKDGSGNSFTEAEADALREWIDGYREQLDSLIEMRTDIIEEIGTVMEENIKRLDRISDKMEHLKSIANSYRNIVDLTGRQYLKINSQLYDAMSATSVKLATQSVDMAKTRMEQANQQYDTLRNNYAKIANQLSDAEKRSWEEQLNSAAEYTQEMTENYYSSWEEAIEAVNERFELAMQNMAEDFNRLMGGAIGNLEGLANRMDLRKNVQDVLVPEYEKMYQLSKLANEAQKAIDGSNNIKVQKELQKVQDKILKAREDSKAMSEYEIQYLEKELELKKAQMALEEAAAIKSQVRMTRDSEGNFSYVYTADTKAVEDAENDYNAKLYEMQKLNEEYIQNLQFQIVDVEQQYISAMQEAADMYGIGTAEYYAAIANIQADYQEYFTSLNEQLDIALTNQTETADEHAKFYEELTGDVYQANVVLTTSWEDTMLAAMTGFETLQEYQNMWDESTAQVFDDAQNAGLAWQEGMDEVYEAAGTSIEGYAETVGSAFTQIIEQGNETAEEMHTMANEADSAIEQIVNAVVSWEEQMSQSIEQMMQNCDQLIDKLNELLALMSEVGASSLDAEIAEMESKLATAKENTAKARRQKDKARSNKKKAYRRVGRRIRKALKRVRKARTALRTAKRRLAAAKRRGNRRAIAAAKRRVSRAKRTLTSARRKLRTTVRRASRRQRKAYKKYRKAVREYSVRKAIYDTATAEQTNIEKALTALYEQRDAQQKAQEPTDQNEKELQETQTDEIDATAVAAAVDANTSSLENALKNIAFSPTIRIDTLPELKQDVNITATFPNVTGSEEVIETLTKGLGELASMYANRQ